MNTIQHQGYITSLVAKKDRSIGYRVETPELSCEERALFFELQNENLTITLKPSDVPSKEYKVSETNDKTPSQRMRSVLYVWWKTKQDKNDFETFYKNKMGEIIEKIKSKIEGEI